MPSPNYNSIALKKTTHAKLKAIASYTKQPVTHIVEFLAKDAQDRLRGLSLASEADCPLSAHRVGLLAILEALPVQGVDKKPEPQP
jgi:hypothetical protein